MKGNDIPTFLFFLLVSCCLWLLQTLSERYETDVVVDVDIVNMPASVEIVNADDAEFAVRLRDAGTVLVGYKFNAGLPVTVDYSELKYDKGRLALPLALLTGRLQSGMKASTVLVNSLSDTLFLEVKREEALLPVAISGVIDAAEHYEIADVEIVPSEVMVTATPGVISEMLEVKTEYVVKKYLKDNVGFSLSLASEGVMTVEPSMVNVYVSVSPLKRKSMRAVVEYVNFPSDFDLSRLPVDVELSFEVSEFNYDKVQPTDFKVELDYNELFVENRRKGVFKISEASSKVRDIKIKPSQISV